MSKVNLNDFEFVEKRETRSRSLKNRIYEKGFKTKLMPSIKRPKKDSNEGKTLVAKLYKSRNDEPVFLQQSSIIPSQRSKRSKKEQKIEVEQIPETHEDIGKEEEDPFKLADEEAKELDNAHLPKSASLGIFRNRPQTNQLSSRTIPHTTSQAFFQKGEPGYKTGFDPLFNKTGLSFSKSEMKMTKYVVDKISGKFNIDKRYVHKEEEGKDEQDENKDEIENAKEIQMQLDEAATHRPHSKLDIYIELVIKNVKDLEEFIYLKKRNPDDPYDLDKVDFKEINDPANNIKEYYTISKKGLTHYLNNKPNAFIPLTLWINERKTYDLIKSLNFFRQFRKWKTLNMWRKNVIRHKVNNFKKALEDKLFLLNPILRRTLLRHRELCFDMEKLRFVELNQQHFGMTVDVPELDDFKGIQEKKKKVVTDQIQDISKTCRDNVREGFNKSLDELKKTQYSSTVDEEFAVKKEGQNIRHMKESAYENLGFPDNMSYEKRSELRVECIKFIRFSYLVDFLAMESLSNVYLLSINELIGTLGELVAIKDTIIVKDKGQRPNSKNKDPLFYVTVDFTPVEISNEELEVEELPDFSPPPLGTSKLEDFIPLYHVREGKEGDDLIEEEEEQVEEQNLDQSDSSSVGGNEETSMVFKRKVCHNITKLFLKIRPNIEAFFSDIMRIVGEGLNSIQTFERWSRHDEMHPYFSVLEEWDDIVGDDWEVPDSNYLNPQEWLEQSPLEEFSAPIRNLFDEAFGRSNLFLETLKPFIVSWWEFSKFNPLIFESPKLDSPVESIHFTLASLEILNEKIENEFPFSADLGLLRVDISAVKDVMLPFTETMKKKLEKILPEHLKKKNKEIKDWISSYLHGLKSITGKIKDFVKQQKTMEELEQKFPKIRSKIEIIGNSYLKLKEHRIDIKKEDDQAFIDTQQSQNALTMAMQSTLESAEKNLETFANKITKNLIPELERKTNEINNLVQDAKFLSTKLPLEKGILELTELNDQVKKLEKKADKYNNYEVTLKLKISRFENLENLVVDLDTRLSMWKSLDEWKKLTKGWIDGKFNEINTEDIKTKADYYTKIVSKCSKLLPDNPVLSDLRELVYSFRDTMPIVMALRNKNLREHHWSDIRELIEISDFEITDEFTLSNLMSMDILKFQKQIQEISTQATQESVLETQYNELDSKWKNLEFILKQYKGEPGKEVFVLSEIEEVYGELDDLLANLNNILGSRYLKMLRSKVENLQEEVLYAQETLDDWLICQKNWIYLENIFSSPDIKKKLSGESALFDSVDKFFRAQMRKTNQVILVSKSIFPGLRETFRKHKKTLADIQKALESYLEQKRRNFPRFYFLSNDELLEILAKANDLETIQKHVKKCFDNIAKLNLGDENSRSTMVQGMYSHEDEKVDFFKNISTKQEIEIWLRMVEEQMKDTLYKKMKYGKNDYEMKERKDWVLEHPGQIVSTISQLYWTIFTEYCIIQMEDNPNSLLEWLSTNYNQLTTLTKLVNSALDPIKHKIIVALITQDVHARDVVENLATEGTSSPNDFLWQKQLRYIWNEEADDLIIRQVNSTLNYGYEYMGATSRLVITPLTDRCWLTITGALNIQLGAAPAGPAGTGKTESTKDLAKGLGKLCVVFNCSEQIEYKMMGRLFSGLAQQGAWTCLDEFNRIDIEVLSVIAQQLLTIKQALERKDKEFYFVEDKIPLSPEYGVFITMNPGYAGRTELPDNLKVLFRPVSMMIPDYRQIAEIILYAEGFENAKPLSNKMYQLYKLASEQLSQQKHYDFGLRAVKSVLVMAGGLKRASKEDQTEDSVLIRAMRESNVPKFLKEDLPLFQALVQDLFPQVEVPIIDYGELQSTIKQGMEVMGLQPVQSLQTKVLQLFETFNVRFGVMIVGETGSGKTSCFKTLKWAMTELRAKNSADKRFQDVTDFIINPKSIAMGELYGEVNFLTQEWRDGLASQIMREASMSETQDFKWVVFDGPVDALWIENMNTVLDDNMMLCLANGQRIKLRHEMRMLFEVQDLAVASPATVSRCGMVYMTYDDLGWRPYVKSWIQRVFQSEEEHKLKLDNDLCAHLMQNFEFYVDEGLAEIRKTMTEPLKTTDIQLIISLCNLLETFISKAYGFQTHEKSEYKRRYISYAFVFSYIWSIGASISEEYHEEFSTFIKKKFQSIIFGNSDNIYGFYFDAENTDLVFRGWGERPNQDFTFNKDQSYFELLVPTIDSVRYSYLIKWLLKNEKQVFVTGGSGTGKTVIISNLLKSIKEPMKLDPVSIIFSAQTSSEITQLTIETKLEKLKKNLLGAKPGKKAVIFIDDINMPQLEKYFAQPPIELLRQLIDKKGFYDRKEWFWKHVENTTLLACAAPPSGGRNELTPRFVRHFNVLNVPQASIKTLFKIFNSILEGYLTALSFADPVVKLSDSVVMATIEIYQKIKAEKLPIPAKFHYTFNLRDVSKVFQGILMGKPKVIQEPEALTRLWVHEISRVFCDRLINDEDRDWFETSTCEMIIKHFRGRGERSSYFGGENTILFSDIMSLEMGRDYRDISGDPKIERVLESKLEDFNFDFNLLRMNLVFFKGAVEHIMRISRVLRQPRGNLMLIGLGGSGKQSLTRLCTYMYEFTSVQVEVTKGYDSKKFHEFIKMVLLKTGYEGKPTVFLFTDNQIVEESFLEDINGLLNSGEVPNLWEPEEMTKIIGDMRPIVEEMGRPGEPDTIYSTFVERVRNFLHIVLCMSPAGDSLRIRCQKFPSLVDCCTLDWFSKWPEKALIRVAKKLLADFSLPNDSLKDSIAKMCKEVHVSSFQVSIEFAKNLKRNVFYTPKSFLDLINLYKQLLTERRNEVQGYLNKFTTGLFKLEEANEQVAELKETLTELQPQLDEQSKKVNEALTIVEKDSMLAREQEIIVEQEAEEVNKQAQDIKIISDEAQAELDIVMPELEKANKKVEQMDKNALTQMKSYANPPAVVHMVMEGVCFLMGVTTYKWETAKKLMIDLNSFLDSLVNYNRENIPKDRLSRLRNHISKNDFDPEEIRKKVEPAAVLAIWCNAMDTYARVADSVRPKKEKVAKLNMELESANATLAEKLASLNKVKENVARLKKDSDEMLQKKMETESTMELTKLRLERARKLTYLLADEGKRWVESVELLKVEVENLIGDVFVSAAAVSYCGPFTGPYRNKIIDQWVQNVKDLQIPCSETFSLITTLGKPVTIREWMINGLPSDIVSQENALYAMKGFKWPLLIDPQFQAKKWLKNTEKENYLKILKFSDQQFQLTMKAALQNGYSVLIQDIDETTDPLIDPVLGKLFYTDKDGRNLIRFADSDVDFDSKFRLFITTKIPNPNYLPEMFIKVNVINFTVTFEGLEDQLLAEVVRKENAQIEEQRDQNIVNLARYRKDIKESEDRILSLLEKSEAILDDNELINTLELSKEMSTKITAKIAESLEIEEKVDTVRSQYKEVSIRGSILFFVIKEMSLLDPMYQYSLQYIFRLFSIAMDLAKPNDDLQKRIENLIETITKYIYRNVSRGLFEAHKLIFSFLISSSINRHKKLVSDEMWSILLRGAGLMDGEIPENPDKTLLSQIQWELLFYLNDKFPRFNGITSSFVERPTQWKNYIGSSEFIEDIPVDWKEKLDDFQKLLLIKALKPEKLMFAISNYVEKSLGKYFLESISASMKSVYEDTDYKTPIIFVLSQGADPTGALFSLAKEMGVYDELLTLSLGQGQGDKAAALIEEGCKKGCWILLQNCHLARKWMPSLEGIVEGIGSRAEEGEEGAIQETFRLFLTSSPVPYFPVSILQNGIKLTTEAPRGLKANLKKSLNYLNDEFLDSCNKGRIIFHKTIMGLCFFHGIVQERKKYGPLGWNIRYDFNDSDFLTSKLVATMLINEQDTIPWDALINVIGDINYGGRVTDDWDRVTLMTILKKFFNPDVVTEGKYAFSESSVYYIPEPSNIEGYIQYLDSLPYADDPEVFGMHDNANIKFQSQESDKMIKDILSIQETASASSGGKSDTEILFEIIRSIEKDIPRDLIKEEGNEDLFVKNDFGLIPSLSTFLLQEMERFNILLNVMKISIDHLKNALMGNRLMSPVLDSMRVSLLNNQIPQNWQDVAYPTLKPLASWFRDLKERVETMRNWLLEGNPVCFWMSGFFFPQGFLTGVLQTHARKYMIPIDTLKFSFKIMDGPKENIVSRTNDGVYVNGLYLEGASWDRRKKTLTDQAFGDMFFPMPVIFFLPIEIKDDNELETQETYTCPVYKTSERAGVLSTTGQSTNFILAIDIPTDQSAEYWTLRGAALISQLND